jgi:2-polyprenyl-3-methyl-5-hydroxy-6-metoxy-1,4-benzoquinol methylase
MNLTQKAWEQVTRLDHPAGFTMGPINAKTWLRDPKHMGFMLARYKFAAKMMRSCSAILEVGCGEGLGTMLMLKDTTASFVSTDFDPAQIRYATEHVMPHCGGRATFQCMDLVAQDPGAGRFDGLLSIDVIEHIHPQDEKAFLDHCVRALKPGGTAILGTPNLHADVYASPPSRAGHVNLFDPDRFTETLERHFSHVFLFSMNDEMVHTGFSKMAHYLMALCVKADA